MTRWQADALLFGLCDAIEAQETLQFCVAVSQEPDAFPTAWRASGARALRMLAMFVEHPILSHRYGPVTVGISDNAYCSAHTEWRREPWYEDDCVDCERLIRAQWGEPPTLASVMAATKERA